MVVRFSRQAGLGAAVLLALASFVKTAAAVEGCPNPNNPRDLVVIGSVAELVGEVGTRVKRALLAAFEMRFERAGNDLNDDAEVLYCDSRQIGNDNTYDRDVVGALNDERVLLEVGAKTDGDGVTVTYVVIPIRHYAFQGQQVSGQGYYESIYDKSKISAGLDQLFKGNAELRLMAALALALRYEKLAEGELDQARHVQLLSRSRAFYCDAIGSLDDAKPRDISSGLELDQWQALSDFANQSAKRLFENATAGSDDDEPLDVVASERSGPSSAPAVGASADPSACI